MGFFNKKQAILNLDGALVYVKNKSQAGFYAQQLLKQCQDSTNIVNRTKTPRVFFERYDLLIKNTDNLVQLEQFIKFKGLAPYTQLKELKNLKETQTNMMIERFVEDIQNQIDKLKTDKAKINTINKAFDNLSKYNEEMTQNNISLYKNYYTKLINNI